MTKISGINTGLILIGAIMVTIMGLSAVSIHRTEESNRSLAGLVDVRRQIDRQSHQRWNAWVTQANNEQDTALRVWVWAQVERPDCGLKQGNSLSAGSILVRSRQVETEQDQAVFERDFARSYQAYLVDDETHCAQMILGEMVAMGSGNTHAIETVHELLRSPVNDFDWPKTSPGRAGDLTPDELADAVSGAVNGVLSFMDDAGNRPTGN